MLIIMIVWQGNSLVLLLLLAAAAAVVVVVVSCEHSELFSIDYHQNCLVTRNISGPLYFITCLET